MSKILLDYVFPISVITPTPAASTAFLKQACVVAKPKSGQEGNVGTITLCTSMTAVALKTDNENAQQLFDAGMDKVYILLMDDLDMSEIFESANQDFYTILISDDYDDTDINGIITTPAVAAALTVGDLIFTAVTAGESGNSITIELTDETSAGEEVAHAVDGAIVIKMADGFSTAQQIKDACDDSVSVSALVTVTIAMGQEAVAQDLAAEAPLEDGANAIIAPGSGIQLGAFEGVTGVSTQDSETASMQAIIENRCAFFTSSSNKAQNLFYAFGKLLSNLVNWNNQQFITMPLNDDIDELGDANNFFDNRVSFVLNDSEFGNRLGFFVAGGRAIAAPYILKNLRGLA